MTLKTLGDARNFIRANDIISFEQSFELSRFCINLLKDKSKEHLGREIAIRVLDNVKKFPSETIELWNDIIELSGLYPYVQPNLLSSSALVRFEYHKAKHLPSICKLP